MLNAEDTKKNFLRNKNTVIVLKLFIKETFKKTYTIICGNCYNRAVEGV